MWVSLTVTGMDCTGCEQRVTRVLRRLDGVGAVTTDHRSGEITAEVDPQLVDRDKLLERLIAAGYLPVGQAS